MIVLDTTRAANLIELARKKFDPELPEQELQVLRDSASAGAPVWPKADAPRPPIRPEFVRWLVTDSEAADQIDANGLRAYGVTIAGPLNMDNCRILVPMQLNRCTVEGYVSFVDAQTGSVFFTGCRVKEGFSAWRMDGEGALFLDGSTFNAAVKLMSARIKSTFSCHGAQILVKKGDALDATGAVFEGGISLTSGFYATGGIDFLDAKITGILDCTGAKLYPEEGDALTLTGATISGSVYLSNGFEATGAVKLQGSEFGGTLTFMGASVAWVLCINMRVSSEMVWLGVASTSSTNLNLTGASVKTFRDDRDSWPAEQNLTLAGFTYGDLILHKAPNPEEIKNGWFPDELMLDADTRVDWLLRQSPQDRLQPQPWMNLGDYLKARGDGAGAKHIVYRLRCVQATEKKTSRLRRALAIRFAWLEEVPLRILYSISVTLLLGLAVFGYAGARGAIAPTSAEAYSAFLAGKSMPAAYPSFNPLAYTLDNAVPLVKLGQDGKWAPDHSFPSRDPLTNYWVLVWLRWGIILFGWFQATVLAAALSGRFKQ